MPARKKPVRPLVLIIISVVLIVLGVLLLKNVLPYHLSPQWAPTAANLNNSGNYDHVGEEGVFQGKKVKSHYIPEIDPPILGENSQNKRIEVDLTNQRVYAIEGNTKVMEFVVSTGKWGRTPTGVFTIAYKVRAQKMEGGSQLLGTYYYLPNVQFVQFFGNDEIPWSRGFSFHGTYWHSNFGTPMSHGCVNMRNEDAEKLYYWSSPEIGDKRVIKTTSDNPGTLVIIYGQAPKS
jgi:lipoprotein-anchoring transpeptidase ErfK/SrfK